MGMVSDFFNFILGGAFTGRTKVSADTAEKIREKWTSSVEFALKNRQPSQLRQALITTDKLLDAALKDVSSGKNMGERLKNAQNLFEWEVYDRLWKAHKVRNALVHDMSYEPTYFVLEDAISDFKEGLKDLGVNL